MGEPDRLEGLLQHRATFAGLAWLTGAAQVLEALTAQRPLALAAMLVVQLGAMREWTTARRHLAELAGSARSCHRPSVRLFTGGRPGLRPLTTTQENQ